MRPIKFVKFIVIDSMMICQTNPVTHVNPIEMIIFERFSKLLSMTSVRRHEWTVNSEEWLLIICIGIYHIDFRSVYLTFWLNLLSNYISFLLYLCKSISMAIGKWPLANQQLSFKIIINISTITSCTASLLLYAVTTYSLRECVHFKERKKNKKIMCICICMKKKTYTFAVIVLCAHFLNDAKGDANGRFYKITPDKTGSASSISI